MNLYYSKQWMDDLDEILGMYSELSELSGKAVLITGGTGLIGSAVVDVLLRYNETHGSPIHLYVAGRSYEKVKGRFGSFCEQPYFKYVPFDATKIDNVLDVQCDYIIHAASNAYPGIITKEPVETMIGNFLGIKSLMEFAINSKVKRVLYISSSEVYGQKENDKAFSENEYGYVDILNPRNSYSIAKRASETLCISYAKEYGVEAAIVRPGHIYGPTASENDNRVSSAWAYSAAKGNNLTMKSDGSQLRSYCYCLDCASAILKVLLQGENSKAYNIANPSVVISIMEMARILAASSGVQIIQEQPSENEKKAFNPMSNSSLNSDSLEALGWKGLFDAERGLSHTVSILRDGMA